MPLHFMGGFADQAPPSLLTDNGPQVRPPGLLSPPQQQLVGDGLGNGLLGGSIVPQSPNEPNDRAQAAQTALSAEPVYPFAQGGPGDQGGMPLRLTVRPAREVQTLAPSGQGGPSILEEPERLTDAGAPGADPVVSDDDSAPVGGTTHRLGRPEWPSDYPSLTAYHPTWRDRLGTWLIGDERPSLAKYNVVRGLLGSTGVGEPKLSLSDFTPLGTLLGLQESAQHNDYLGAAASLVPGVRGGGKVLRAGERELIKRLEPEIAELAKRVEEIHGVLHKRAQTKRTTSVLSTYSGRYIIAGGRRDLEEKQINALKPGEIPAMLPSGHSETTALHEAKKLGEIPRLMQTKWNICPDCVSVAKSHGGKVIGRRTIYFPPNE